GTGKELVARAIHAWSGRTGPFYAINCATLSASIADAELFGYRRGAFTGAGQGHLGHFRAAHGGTLFLDEIAELSLESQAKLLRALEQREVLPIGEHRAVAVDVRVVCASQTELERAVAQGQFRADLRARLSGHTCVLPALRERREDVPALFLALLGRYTAGRVPALSAKLVEALCLYSWPNNVRELELLARSLTALHADEARLGREFLPENIRGAPLFQPAPARREAESTRENYELTELARVLHSTGGNVARAAAELGLSRQRLYRLMDRRPVREFMNEYSSQQASTKAADAE
ncbi:MAG TPA: sigma 54-interacting transcriptional regulator, partial [Polyangiaceae bacterium]|nr:sigma 54-interacting transcriptional regulator [Polyangiaceae bacterium]